MSAASQDRFAAGMTVPGLLGCGLRLPDATCLSYSFDGLYPRAQWDPVLEQLAEMMTRLTGLGLAPHRLVWTFEQGQIFLIRRPDGALLALATQPNTEASENVDQLAEEFFSLSPGG
ncbi:MAG TPA: hypothetical protein VG077_16385 [Verrucomicrobiae bacterium]|nr:hypothetical protein [Verrucomicrobiae bacterium]